MSGRPAGVRCALETRAATGCVAGPELEDALSIARRLATAQVACTIGYWDGPGAPGRSAAAAARRTFAALSTDDAGLDGVVALQAPPLVAAGCSVDGAAMLLGAASSRRVVVDAPAPDGAADALELALALSHHGWDAGIALPGRWSRAEADAEVAVRHGLAVRLVKGESPDPSGAGTDPGAGMLALARRLAGRARHVAVASHDPNVSGPALETLLDAGTSCELELLLGPPVAAVVEQAKVLGVPVRVYVPWGTHASAPYDDLIAARRHKRPAWRLHSDATVCERRWRRTLSQAGRERA